jgi:hypothetical protein
MATTAYGTHRPTSAHLVRVDLLFGAGLIVITAAGRLLWQAADAGLFDTFGTR